MHQPPPKLKPKPKPRNFWRNYAHEVERLLILERAKNASLRIAVDAAARATIEQLERMGVRLAG